MSRVTSFAVLYLLCVCAVPAAWGQTLYAFDLPRQSLADSLTAIGRQTETNILFDPTTVEHITAPAVHAQLSADDAIALVLAGTKLTAERTAANTLLVRPAQKPEKNTSLQGAGDAVQAGLEEVVVTGSFIPQLRPDTASPEITISAQNIEDQGFRNAYEALRMLPIANGSVQDSQLTGGFTPGASSISLFGLDPSFTLTLLNGRPLADYPLPFNGASDITDLANIPVGLIDHIDVLTGAASSIYGSSAIAGVVNVVLKEKAEGVSFTVRGGGYSQGGGENQRAQLFGGFNFDRLDVLYGLELTHQREMLQRQAPGLSLLGHDNVNTRNFLILARGAGYVDPGAATCAPLADLFGHTLTYSHRPSQGYYCGSPAAGYNSILNADNQIDGLVSVRYHLSADMLAYTQLLDGHAEPTYSGGLPGWSTNRVPGNVSGYIWDATTRQPELLQRIFSPEEVGGWNGTNQHVYTHEFNGSAGLKGAFGDSGINYDAYFHLSQENTHYVSYSGNYIDQRATAYYLGPELGVTAEGYPIYAPNLSRFYSPITPAQYASLIGARSEYSVSWTDDFTIILDSSKLFSLPAGDVGAAVVAQYGTDELHAPPDPNAVAGVFDGSTARPNSSGSRDHYSLGSEFRLPIARMLTADVSGRYDHYTYAGGTGYGGSNGAGKFTYKGGLEFRPHADLLLRANYATAFRTPDLFYLFEGPTGSYSSVTDWYQCRLAGYTSASIQQCPLAAQGNQVSPLTMSSGSTTLKNVTAKSFTTGIVWSALESRLRISIDYSRVDISNKVQQTDLDALLQTEADCRLGASEAGLPYDINSPTCRNALALVQRQSPVGVLDSTSITKLISVPTNIALEHEAGIQSEIRYSWATDHLGRFSADAAWFRQLEHTTRNFAGDVPLNLLCCGNNDAYNNDEFVDTFSTTLSWNIGRFSTTLHGTRYAPTWRYDGSARDVGPWVVINGSEKLTIAPSMFLELIVNNITNRQPPSDPTSSFYPYYDTGSYNGFGRAWWLEFGAKVGGSRR